MKQRYDELRSEAWNLPDGKQKVTVLEEAVRIADLYMSKEDAYYARMSYSEAALMSGFEERFIVSFAWCLSQFEKQPELYDSHQLIWHYKWLIGIIWRFPQFGAVQIADIYYDFKRMCLQYGHSLRPYYSKIHMYALVSGHAELAQTYYEAWRKAPYDAMSDCRACEQNMFGYFHLASGRYKRGLQTLKPILSGKMSCRSIPQNTYSHVLMPLLEIDQHDEAAKLARKCSRMLKGPGYLEEYGRLIGYYAATDLNKAAKLLESTAAYAISNKTDWNRFQYLIGAKAFFSLWNEKKRKRKLNVHSSFTSEWVEAESERLARAFDDRNGNEYCQGLLAHKVNQVRKRRTC
ncbi:hypothetical protein [Paenibacillus harenae]|uniref:hypothetical protein n=1 Tax=Paenibacillus harenae TaxID=306543 RepID=UPI00278D0941|nr:hypothetical protein [Paenibacillus harenae]MDQ0059364.1 hypothetical protein [Paenibacillus harenae]